MRWSLASGVLVTMAWAGCPSEPTFPVEALALKAHVVVRESAGDAGTELGILERHARVRVTACEPRCFADEGWARLESGGVVPLAALRLPAPVDAPAPGKLGWVTLRGAAVDVFGSPDAGRPLGTLPGGRTVAVVDERADAGWLELHAGGFVRTADVRRPTPSTFRGWLAPDAGVLGFAVHAVDGGVARHEAFPVERWSAETVETPRGPAPRRWVRLARERPRPKEVPPGAKWVHVELSEQVLTAYEGDTLVFATLVSTGTEEHPTTPGLRRVWHKAGHDRMVGDDYWVEEVPWVLYFRKGEGLHGTFWHDDFGRPRSHGCVNLSLDDAAWLFAWAPPTLPVGWHSVVPRGRDTLTVQVERRPPPAARP